MDAKFRLCDPMYRTLYILYFCLLSQLNHTVNSNGMRVSALRKQSRYDDSARL